MDGAPLPAGILRDRIFIDGRWIDAAERCTFAVNDPASSRVLAEIPDGGAADARAAADAAHGAFPEWRARTAADRARILKRWHALILERREDLARLMTLEQGKPLRESRAEIDYAASFVEWFAEEARRAYGEIIPSPHAGRKVMVVREPIGVVAAITPWNFPAAMLTRKAAPALAAGCTVVAKPAEDAPLSSLALAHLAAEAGLPAGVLNVVTASRARAAQVVDVWLADFRVRKLTFTGSTAVGKHLARESADTLKKVSLELGGNAPFIVFEDADLEAAVAGLMAAKFRNAGQTCICPNRVFVHERVVEPFTSLLTRKVKSLRVGRGIDEATEIGPLINARAIAKVEEHIADAVAHGARLIIGGRRACVGESEGHFFEPTIIANVTPEMRLSCEETFGPVVPISTFDDERAVVGLANGTPYGLAAYFYTRDAARIWRVSGALETGMVAINDFALSSEVAPFGGVKASGYGREGSRHGLDEFLHTKYVLQGGLA
ncbi:MAG TPA: NAD-dependent succinate-semialdehyde dehydrogenase [Usitatibacter sp.]|nr:NAD-dependent succinate-semialdehyde dehydrogenase [Usitatibacter sp.]